MSERPFFDLIGNLLDYEDTIGTAIDEAKKKFISSTRSSWTKEITDNGVRRFKFFLLRQGESRKPFQLDVTLVGAFLSKYTQQMKKNDGDEYEPDS